MSEVPEEVSAGRLRPVKATTDGQRSAIRRVASLETLCTVVGSLIIYVVATGPSRRMLSGPTAVGDGLSTYAATGGRVSDVSIAPHLAYPYGIDTRYFPGNDIISNNVTRLISSAFHSSFAGLNLLFVLSFPIIALAALWLFHQARISAPLSAVLALAFTALPFHFWRFEHIYLSMYWSLPIGLGLALRIARGDLEHIGLRPVRRSLLCWTPIIALSLVVAWSGVYYTIFSTIIVGLALLFRIPRCEGWRRFLANLVVPGVVVTASVVVLLPGFIVQRSATTTIYERSAYESVFFSGQIVDAILPSTASELPLANEPAESLSDINAQANASGAIGVRWVSDHGSVFTLISFALLCWWSIVAGAKRRSQSSRNLLGEFNDDQILSDQMLALQFVVTALILTVLLIVPFGFNSLFAVVLSSSIRAWDRLIPMFQLLLLLGAGLVIEQRGWIRALRKRPLKRVMVVGLAISALLFDTVLPARAFFKSQADVGAMQYWAAAAISARVEELAGTDCAILQLPFMEFPESAGREDLGVYEPFWVGLAGRRNSWSYGGIRGSEQDLWLRRVSVDPASNADELRALDFCGILVDSLGLSEGELATLVASLQPLFGAPTEVGLRGTIGYGTLGTTLLFVIDDRFQ